MTLLFNILKVSFFSLAIVGLSGCADKTPSFEDLLKRRAEIHSNPTKLLALKGLSEKEVRDALGISSSDPISTDDIYKAEKKIEERERLELGMSWNEYIDFKRSGKNIKDVKKYLDGYNKDGFDKNGFHKLTKTRFNEKGYDENGYDRRGFSKSGYHKHTHTLMNMDGYDKHGNYLKGHVDKYVKQRSKVKNEDTDTQDALDSFTNSINNINASRQRQINETQNNINNGMYNAGSGSSGLSPVMKSGNMYHYDGGTAIKSGNMLFYK